MPWRLFAAAWSYELASWFAFLTVVSWLEEGGRLKLVGLYFVLYNGVQLPVAALLGPTLDRIERGRGLLLAVVLPFLPLMLVLAQGELWAGLLLGAAFALSDYLFYTLVPAAVPMLLAPERVMRANALWQTGSGILFVVAPAASGTFLDRFGRLPSLALVGGLLLIAALLVAGLRVGRAKAGRKEGGWREVFRYPLAVRAAFSVFLAAIGGGMMNASLPALAGAGRDYGLVLSAIGAGSLTLTLAFTHLRSTRPLGLARVGVAVQALAVLTFALGRSLFAYLPAGWAAGAGSAAFHLGLDTALQVGLPGRVLARAFSLGWAVGNLGQLLGSGALGAFGEAVGVRRLLLLAALAALFAFLPLRVPGGGRATPRSR